MDAFKLFCVLCLISTFVCGQESKIEAIVSKEEPSTTSAEPSAISIASDLPVLQPIDEIMPASEVVHIQELQIQDEARGGRSLDLRIHRSAVSGKQPVILFSPTVGARLDGTDYLTDAWSRAGYVCITIGHTGSGAEAVDEGSLYSRAAQMKKAANFRQLVHRIRDINFLLDWLSTSASTDELGGVDFIDMDSIGMAGQGFGGLVAQLLMGQQLPNGTQFPETRIDAFCVISPTGPKLGAEMEAFRRVFDPVLCVSGSRDGHPFDPSVTPESRARVFRGLPRTSNKYSLSIDRASHAALAGALGVSDENGEVHGKVAQLSTQFWDAHLRGDTDTMATLSSTAPQSELDEQDTWEWR